MTGRYIFRATNNKLKIYKSVLIIINMYMTKLWNDLIWLIEMLSSKISLKNNVRGTAVTWLLRDNNFKVIKTRYHRTCNRCAPDTDIFVSRALLSTAKWHWTILTWNIIMKRINVINIKNYILRRCFPRMRYLKLLTSSKFKSLDIYCSTNMCNSGSRRSLVIRLFNFGLDNI